MFSFLRIFQLTSSNYLHGFPHSLSDIRLNDRLDIKLKVSWLIPELVLSVASPSVAVWCHYIGVVGFPHMDLQVSHYLVSIPPTSVIDHRFYP